MSVGPRLPVALPHASKLESARGPRPRGSERMLVVDPARDDFADFRISDLPSFLRSDDGLVINDSATLPASLRISSELELRLVRTLPDGTFEALALGAGAASDPTETRGPPPPLALGARLDCSGLLVVHVVGVDRDEPGLLRLRIEARDGEYWPALYRAGKPIQYAHVTRPLSLGDVQNVYAARPWSFEMPSAGRPLAFRTLFALEARGVTLTHLTHAAGISSTGSAALDARLPLAERYELGEKAASAIARVRKSAGRVVAVGTSVVRALETCAAADGEIRAGGGETTLRIDERSRLRVVDGLVSGLHEPGSSHFRLLQAFCPLDLLGRATAHAGRAGYLQHEFGDSCLVLRGALDGQPR